MTKILNGYAQPDIEATKGSETRLIFVETPKSLEYNAKAIGKSLGWLKRNNPEVEVDLVVTKPKRKRIKGGEICGDLKDEIIIY